MRQYKMKIVCSWCGKTLGWKQSKVNGTSHGICDDCLKKNYPDLWHEKQIAKMIEKL